MVVDAVIFDFDDTLVETNCIFEAAREKFFAIMSAWGCADRDSMAEFLNQADIRRVMDKGYMAKDCFPLALRETYEHFIALSGREADAAAGEVIENIGWEVYDISPCYTPGAREVLSALQGKVRLFLLTQGDSDMQQERLTASELLNYFDGYRIVKTKDQAAYLDFVADMQIDIHRSWMIGNSLRSDINPALAIGMNAIHYQLPAWDFEHEEPVGLFASVDKLRDVLEVLPL